MVESGGRIGLFGGSFDPVHYGHLIIAADALEQFMLERVLFIPAAHSPLKTTGPVAGGEARLTMLNIALQPYPEMEACDLEIHRGGCSYSVETVQELQQRYPGKMLYWILGADQFQLLDRWHAVEILCGICTFLVYERPGHSVKPPPQLPVDTQWKTLKKRRIDIASTEIRGRISSGKPYVQFVTPKVAAYIKTNQLYTSNNSIPSNQPAYGS